MCQKNPLLQEVQLWMKECILSISLDLLEAKPHCTHVCQDKILASRSLFCGETETNDRCKAVDKDTKAPIDVNMKYAVQACVRNIEKLVRSVRSTKGRVDVACNEAHGEFEASSCGASGLSILPTTEGDYDYDPRGSFRTGLMYACDANSRYPNHG